MTNQPINVNNAFNDGVRVQARTTDGLPHAEGRVIACSELRDAILDELVPSPCPTLRALDGESSKDGA